MTVHFLNPRPDRDAVTAAWQSLAETATHSYFLSSGWVETWLDNLPQDADVRLALIRDDSGPLAAAFVGHANVVRQRLFRSYAYLLNQTGSRTVDQLYIEDNDFLCREGANVSV